MFEVSYRVSALIESDTQGKRVFHVYSQQMPLNEDRYLSFLDVIYQQEVYRLLQAGDTLTVSAHVEPGWRELERTVRFNTDRTFEGDGLLEPVIDLLPVLTVAYADFLSGVNIGELLTVMFRIQRA